MTIHAIFDSIEDMAVAAATGVRPPERLTVSEAATKYRKLDNPGSYKGPWLNEKTPYLVEPMDCLTDDLYSTVCFVGPAQCGKTDMFLNYLTYTVKCDPMDTMLIQTAQGTARDFSLTRVDRLHMHSEDVGKLLIQRRDADNTYDKQYQNGMILRLAWPSKNELAGRPVPRLWLTDYDRMDQNIGGEGSPYKLAKARTTSFRRFGRVVVESSPSFIQTDMQWMPKTRHEAPPTEGILQIYNEGDRRRWYWRCVSCKSPFEPHRRYMAWAPSEDIQEAAETAHIVCPHCSQKYYEFPTSVPGKEEMNQLYRGGGNAQWIKDGQIWLKDGTVAGKFSRSPTASFWLFGAAAAFADWKGLVSEYLSAERVVENNGNEEDLKTVLNTKFGEVYIPRALALSRVPEALKSRAKDYGIREVPHGVRFLVATIDVQKNRYIVQVHGIGTEDIWIIDRYEVKYSKRPQEDRPDQVAFVNPAAHGEDWRLLVSEVMMKTYPLAGEPDRHMAIFHTFCDSGGREGVTANAYNFVRWLRAGYEGSDESEDVQEMYPWHPHLAGRFQLVKGEPKLTAPRVRLGFPDSERKDRHAGARGEIPVLFINSNLMKDHLNGVLDRTEPGGRVNFPNWLPINFYKELTVETKDPKTGKWENLNKFRNESWDLLVYCLSGLLHRAIGWEHIMWDDPPSWAAEWDKNDMIFNLKGEEVPFASEDDDDADLSSLGELLG